MEHYQNLGQNSGMLAYQLGHDYIVVQFKDGQIAFYKYTYASASSSVVEVMKNLARQGKGLHSYISNNKPAYTSKGLSLDTL